QHQTRLNVMYVATRPSRRRTRLHRTVLWGMVAFYMVASGRALVPGLCGTIAAAEARAGAQQVSMAAARSCCQLPLPDASGDHDTPPADGDAGTCAFCNLVQTFGQIPVYVRAPEPWAPHHVHFATPSSTRLASP